MAGLWAAFMDWIYAWFWRQEMELTLVGLQNAGKTTLVNAMSRGQFSEDMIPTVGFNMRKVTRGGVVMKLWDLGGQARFRSLWPRYCRGVDAIVFVCDAADRAKLAAARVELHDLLGRPALAGIPVLVLGNKNDLAGALDVDQLIDQLELRTIVDREICCYAISAKTHANLEITLQWLTQHAGKGGSRGSASTLPAAAASGSAAAHHAALDAALPSPP
ncbi:hypothetical protein CXG81DRAFT_11751 [Caulochytrium protostelioides]|uniref:P-loop containing nucleoside triphosphate hydrolase protein n=1 Tax=Caulochytrium protostelioides TaxID=1555241 RepID=A0A4V1IUS9_9FUNG|nr:hypothetical protein CXG81DRAFT_11751 [Caulochytrium protostelioides]|eukprot:RKP01619.1 hypothetical protein CXG81DRAFT_11751 [Caulochytrium protostelioides]